MDQHILFGRQLMFDEFTNDIIEEPIKYWKTMDDVPEHIKEFILNTTSSRVIYDSNTKQYHCSKCLKVLDEHYYCNNCSKQCRKPVSNDSKYVIHTSINSIKDYTEDTKYLVFDIVDGQVLLYIFCVDTYYYNRMIYIPYQINKISIEEVYHVTKDGLTNLLTGYFASYQKYKETKNSDDVDCELLNIFSLEITNHYLYTDNLTMLQKTSLYRYTSIWDLKEYFETNNFNLESLTYYPIYLKQFEYLVKMKLYGLAATGTDRVDYRRNFKDTFGIDKKYYSFMKEIDINGLQFEALKLQPTTDIDLINFICNYMLPFDDLLKYAKADKIKSYLDGQELDYCNLYQYHDYIRCCECLSFNMKDKQTLFPKVFSEQYGKIIGERFKLLDPKINERISSLSNILELNRYEDDQYIIFPADSVESLIDESSQMSNCVRYYCSDVSNNVCQIYFMRYKDTIDKSLVTIEVRDGKIVQARTRFNEMPTEDMNAVLKKWEEHIIPITNSY